MGFQALTLNTSGSANTAIGRDTLVSNTDGISNTAVGYEALQQSTGTNNVTIGKWAGVGITTANNVICIGNQGTENLSDTCYIGQIWNRTASGGTAVFINSNGRLGTTTSSRRFKEDVKPMNNASEALFDLKPVTFRYKKETDPRGIPQFGLIAEEVKKVDPNLVVRDNEGKVNAMLLNEFLKKHKKVEEQQTTIKQLKSNADRQSETIAELKRDIGVLNAQLKEQAAQIQKVSAQVQVNKRTNNIALNNS